MSGRHRATREAVLLVGPTGAGKTPLGEYLQAHGLQGRACAHFDFGDNLRRVGAGEIGGFLPAEIDFVRRVLDEGVLLENDTFFLAEKILESFLRRNGVNERTLLVMNGLPRHAGQAADVARLLRMVAVVHLVCPAETVVERLRRDTGGDRAGRRDDLPALVARKLATYSARTKPLVEWYRRQNVPVIDLEVDIDTQPMHLVQNLVDVEMNS